MKKSSLLRFSAATACFLAALPATRAALVHHYDFNTANVANDTVGTANGTLVSSTGGTATVTGGSLVTTGGGSGGGGTPQSPGAYLTGAATAGITGDFSIETFFTRADTQANYATLFSFATDTNNYVIAVAERGNNTFPSVAAKLNGGTELTLNGTATLPAGTQFDLTTTYTASTGLLSFYLNGALVTSGNLLGLNLSAFSAFNGIQGNAPYGDPALNGSNNDFRIFNNALTATQVTQLDTLGANATNDQINAAVPEPSTVALLTILGTGGLFLRRRRA